MIEKEKTIDIKTLKDFFGFMNKSVFFRRRIVENLLKMEKPSAYDVRLLNEYSETLRSACDGDYKLELKLDAGKTVLVDASYELKEFEKDLEYVNEGEDALYSFLSRNTPGFSEHVEKATDALKGIKFKNFISDRDGTVNNYCGRYLTSAQSVYNAVFLSRFSDKCVTNAVILTSAPLDKGGLVDVNTIPPGKYIFAGSKAREFFDVSGRRITYPVPRDQAENLDILNGRLTALISTPGYEKYGMIGSALQKKFGQTTIARQDVTGSVSAGESMEFKKKVLDIVKEIDPDDKLFRIEDTGYDIEILLTIENSESNGVKDFDKGDGVRFIDKNLCMGIDKGANLVCGDTPSDIPMLETCRNSENKTAGVFVTREKELIERVNSCGAYRTVIVPQPDMLVAALNELSKL